MTYDLLIKNARIVDGGRGEPFSGDLAVQDGKIAALGSSLGPAKETVNADGLVLMPGIIDGHTHFDAQITWDPFVDPSVSHGVTTVVIGSCGFSIAPCRPEDRELSMRNLTHVEGMSLDALLEGVRWDFESFPEYLSMLERQGVGPNVVAYLGHSSLRTYVLREEAPHRVATDDEIARMADIVREAMASGAVGFATTKGDGHNGENGLPMPSRLADTREFEALTKAMAASGRGIFMISRSENTSIASIESITEKCGRPTLISGFLVNNTNPERHKRLLKEIADARGRGNMMWGQVMCTPFTMDFSLQAAYVFEGYPAWKPAMQASGDDLKRVYADREFREAVKQDFMRYRGTSRTFNSEWDKLKVLEVTRSENKHLEGKSLEELAGTQGKHPLDALLDFALSEDLQPRFTALLLNADDQAVGEMISDAGSYVTLSDAGAHTTFMCEAGFGLHLLGVWVRDRGVMSLQEAVYKLTAHPARIFGIPNRGRLLPGYAADLMLFDPDRIGRTKNRRVHDFPAKSPRLVSSALGLHGVWINGTRVVLDDKGAFNRTATPGRILRDFIP